jgi:hypothetical protein
MADFNEDVIAADPNSPRGIAIRWQKEIDAAGKEQHKFHEDSRKIVRRYLDKRDAIEEGESRVNLFWSTIETMKASLYAKPPKADVVRSYFDPNDDVARVAATILERALNSDTESQGSSFDNAVRNGIEDWLIVGMGQVWMRYEVETEQDELPPLIDPITGQETAPATPMEVIKSESAVTDYVFWEDFLYSPARTWEEVRWVARRVWLTKTQAKNRFGDEITAELTFGKNKSKKDVSNNVPQNDPWGKAEIFEIWDREEKKAYWYSKGVDVILDVKDDPLRLDNFWPCPKPAMMNSTTSNFIPRALYVFAQDQFDQLDKLDTRIAYLTKAAKVAGVYDKTADGVQRLFKQGVENTLTPIENWAMFAERGGIKGSMEFIPIEPITNAIEKLRTYRQDKVQQIYEVLGISDIMRGNTKASETATAQQIKAQFGSTRLQYYQNELARWVTDALRIKTEIMAVHFQPETIIKMSNIMMTVDAQFAQPAVELIKTLGMEQYRIRVESDTMAAVDWAAKREESAEVLNGIANYFAQMQGVIQNVPNSLPTVLQILQASLSGIKGSSAIESILDQAIAKQMEAAANPPPPPQPSPMEMAELANKEADTKEKHAKAEKLLSDIDLQNLQTVHLALNPPPPPGMAGPAVPSGPPPSGPQGGPQGGPPPAPADAPPMMEPQANEGLPPGVIPGTPGTPGMPV